MTKEATSEKIELIADALLYFIRIKTGRFLWSAKWFLLIPLTIEE
jgi:hypothetical protein